MNRPHTNRAAAASHQRDRLKDEIYRHMFRVEEKRPGAELDLAIALLQAWMAPSSASGRQWLRQICPLCLVMLQASRQTSPSAPCSQPSPGN
jgi:hypothetical protein